MNTNQRVYKCFLKFFPTLVEIKLIWWVVPVRMQICLIIIAPHTWTLSLPVCTKITICRHQSGLFSSHNQMKLSIPRQNPNYPLLYHLVHTPLFARMIKTFLNFSYSNDFGFIREPRIMLLCCICYQIQYVSNKFMYILTTSFQQHIVFVLSKLFSRLF